MDRRAQPLERLRKYYAEFLARRCPGEAGRAAAPPAGDLGDQRQPWAPAAAAPFWAAAGPVPKQRAVEVHGYSAGLLEGGRLCFEEARARDYRQRQQALRPAAGREEPVRLTMIDVGGGALSEDDLDDVPSLAVAVNPDDLTHISVYRDNTADLKELARLAARQNQLGGLPDTAHDKENVRAGPAAEAEDAVMAYVGEEEDPFERIQGIESGDAFGGRAEGGEANGAFGGFPFERRLNRLSLIPEESEFTQPSELTQQSSLSAHAAVRPFVPVVTSEVRQKMESLVNPGSICDLLVVHESALAKVRQLDKSVGRDGTGPNQTVSALRIANGHFFIERRLAPARLFVAVDLEADVASGRCNQWALKIVSPPSRWEPYVVSRLPGSPLFPRMRVCCHYNDVLFTTLTYYEQGSLAAVLRTVGALDELLVLFYTGQLLAILAELLAAGIVHTRISLEHLLVRAGDAEGPWAPQYRPDGAQGWAGKGLALTGFAKAVDLQLLAALPGFGRAFRLEGSELVAHEADMQACLGVVQRLLGLPSAPTPADVARLQFAALWQKVFSFLASRYSDLNTPALLASLCAEVANTLEVASTQCAPTLKSLLTKLEIALLSAS